MINEELRSSFDESVETREFIQNTLRINYKDLKKLVENIGGIEPGDFKLLVDMYHYRHGGYPTPNSKPKHQELIRKFATMYKLLNFLGQDFFDTEAYGIKVQIIDKIEDKDIISDDMETIKNFGFQTETLREFIEEAMFRGDDIQSNICACSDQIKNKGKELEETAGMKKKHFTAAVMTEYKRRDALHENNEKKIAKIEKDIDETYESFTKSMALLDSEDAKEDE